MVGLLRHQWHDLLRTWAVEQVPADRAFEDVGRQYATPGRFYHTLTHIRHVLETVDGLGPHAEHLDAVRLAAWLHDAVYDSRASDNEERSAEYAARLCRELLIPVGGVVASLILNTKTHDAGPDDHDARVLIDADLAILGASEPAYRAYAENIRREYAWVPESDYRRGRRQVLEHFLARHRIFHFLRHLEGPARRNLVVEVAWLAY